MASRRFPDSGSRYATRRNGDQASNGVIVYFLDADGQNRAEVYAERGTDHPDDADLLVNSQTHLDAFGGQLDFRGPDGGGDVWGPAELFASVDDGPIFRVAAAPEPRFQAIEERLDVLTEAGVSLAAQEYVDAGDALRNLKTANLSDVANATTARTNLSVPTLVKRDNGGAVLEPVRVPTLAVDQVWPTRDYDLRILWVDPDGLTMYALGWEAMVYKSVDGGATWTRQGYNALLAAPNGTFLKTSAGTLLTFASGAPSTVYRSTNDGVSWTLVHTWPTLGSPRALGPTGWAIDPVTNYIYAGEYQTVDTAITVINVYRSIDDGATWPVFHAFPGPATSDPAKVRHVHAIQWDHVAQRIVVMTGDSDPAAGMYKVNDTGTDLEPMLLNNQVTLADSVEGARAIGIMPFTDYIAWTGDATSNPYVMRVARSELSNPQPAAQRVYRLNSTGWFTIRARDDGSRWVFSASQESASFRLDKCVHLYAVEDQGATVFEIGAMATDSTGLAALAPVGLPENGGDVFWIQAHSTTRAGVWKCRLARGFAGLQPSPARPLVYAWQTMNTQGSVTVPVAVGAVPGVVVIGRDTTPAFVRKLHIFNAGASDDAGVFTNLKLRVRKVSDGSTLYECIVPSDRQAKHAEAGGPIATITTLASTNVVEFILANTSTGGTVSGSGFVTYGWGP